MEWHTVKMAVRANACLQGDPSFSSAACATFKSLSEFHPLLNYSIFRREDSVSKECHADVIIF